MDAMWRKVSKHIKLYACVVPYPVIEKIQEIQRAAIYGKGSFNQCSCEDSGKVIIQEIKGIKTLDVKKEIQRNDWFTDFLEAELHSLEH